MGMVLVAFSARIFATEHNRFDLYFTLRPSSLALSFAVGFVVALATIVGTSLRVSRLNIIAAIRDLAIVIAPVVPGSSARLLDAMGVPAPERDYAALDDPASYDRLARSGFTLAPPTPIFPKLEVPAQV